MAIKIVETDFRISRTIDISKSSELLYWSEKYNVSVDKVRETVNAVGSLVKNVETKLRQK